MNSEAEIVRRVLDGDTDAYEALVTKYQGTVYALALADLKDPQDAEDVTQETFVRTYTALPRLRDPAAFGPWLFIIARRLRADFFRGRLRLDTGSQALRNDPTVARVSDDTRLWIEARDRASALWRAVNALDGKSRQALVLHYGRELKTREIAALEGLNESTVKMRLKRARHLLGEQLGALKGAFGGAPSPAVSAGVMKAVKSVGPLKAMATPLAIIWGPVAGWALFLRWFLGQDVERLRGRVSDTTLRRLHLGIWIGVLFFPLYMVSLAVARSYSISPYLVMVPFLAVPLFGVYVFVSNVLAFAPKLTRIRVLAYHAIVVGGICLMQFDRDHTLLYLGFIILLQPVAWISPKCPASFNPRQGFWPRTLLSREHEGAPQAQPVQQREVCRWLSLLFENGIVMAPVRKRDGQVSVSLRLSQPWRVWLFWLPHSRLTVAQNGSVMCDIVPADYADLVAQPGAGDLLSRRDLESRLAMAFAASLAAHDGSDAEALSALGLSPSCDNGPYTNHVIFMKYVLPTMGLILVLLSLVDLLGG